MIKMCLFFKDASTHQIFTLSLHDALPIFDSKSARELLDTMEDLNQNDGITTLMVTHDPFAASFASRILFIKDGKIGKQMLKNELSRQEFYHLLIDQLDTDE